MTSEPPRGVGDQARRSVHRRSVDGLWTLERVTKRRRRRLDLGVHFTFSQRFSGTFTDDGKRIDGTFEIAHDHVTWEKDFDVVYTRVG